MPNHEANITLAQTIVALVQELEQAREQAVILANQLAAARAAAEPEKEEA